MKMNPLIKSALKSLIGDESFKEELRTLLVEVEDTSEVSRAQLVERQDSPMPPAPPASPTASEVAPEAAKEIVVDDALMGQIVAALTSDDAFMTKLATKVSELQAAETPVEEAPMNAEQAQEITQSMKLLQRGLEELLAEGGHASTTRARSTGTDDEAGNETKKSLANRAASTLQKMTPARVG